MNHLIEVRLQRTNFRTRRHCLFCGGCSDKDTVNAEIWSAVVDVHPGQTTVERTMLIVCERCLGADAVTQAATIREQAAWHRERADELETIAASLPPLPSRAEWEQANAAEDAVSVLARRGMDPACNEHGRPF